MKKLFFLLFSLSILYTGRINGQSPSLAPSLIPPSPESSALAKFINIPVGFETGIPNIEIPLYELKIGDIVLPITLRYHSTGLKAYDPVGWIGMGWSLSAEPVITRKVNGLADEQFNGYTKPTRSIYTSEINYLVDLVNGDLDEQPDEFYYTLANQSGRFFFSRPYLSDTASYQIFTVPYKPIKIVYNPSNSQFTIKDGDGIHYTFGNTAEFLERELNFGVTTGWKASQIYSSTYNVGIDFSYHAVENQYFPALTDQISVEDSLQGVFSFPECYRSDFPVILERLNGMDKHKVYVSLGSNYGILEDTGCLAPSTSSGPGMSNGSRNIKKINFPGGSIEFEKGTGGRLLRVIVTSVDGVVKSFVFDQTFYDSYAYNKRLRLNSVRIHDATDTEIERYTFEYRSGPMPDRYLTKNVDLWGYYNGDGSEYLSSVPFQTVTAIHKNTNTHVNFQIGGSSRMPNPEYAQYGILRSITYPTGGTTHFEFEGNQVIEQGFLQYGPGLRIREIKHIDDMTGHTTRKVYRYGENETGVGMLTIPAEIMNTMIEQENLYLYHFNTWSYTTRNRIYYSNAMGDLFFSDGAPVRYPEVAEYELTPSNLSNGKTVYKYDAYWSPPVRFPGTNIVERNWDDWRYWKLLSKETFKYEGGNYIPIQKQRLSYQPYVSGGTYFVKAFRKRSIISDGPPPANNIYEDIFVQGMGIGGGEMVLTSDTLITYTTNGDSVVHGTRHEYKYQPGPLHNLKPRRTIVSGSNGTESETYFVYPQDTVFSGARELGRRKLLQDWRILHPISSYAKKGQSTEHWEDEFHIVGGRAKAIGRKRIWKKNNLIVGTKEVTYERYDADGNLEQYTVEGKPTVTFLWGYGGLYPVAKIENATYAEVEAVLGGIINQLKFLSVSSSFVDDAIGLLRADPSMRKATVTTYTYRPFVGLSGTTDPRSQITGYGYDTFNRLETVKDGEGNIREEYHYNYRTP